MEQEGLLDVDNEVHLFCLHYIFIPRINDSLVEFMNAWNTHPPFGTYLLSSFGFLGIIRKIVMMMAYMLRYYK